MSSTALVKAREEIDRMKARTAGARARAEASAKTLQRDATTLVGAAAFGAFKRDRMRAGQALPTVLGLDGETTAVVALYLVGHFASGMIGEVAHDAAVGIAAGAIYQKMQA